MRINYKILEKYIDFKNLEISKIIDGLLKIGIDIDHIIDNRNNNDFVVGKITNIKKHPNANRLNLCTVKIADNKNLSIVCGANNVSKGIYVCVAKINAKLSSGLKIKKQKIRGIYSNGMICSLTELGIKEKFIEKDEIDGIHVFKNISEIKIGDNALQQLNLDNLIIDFELTLNRHDLMSIYNLASELARQLELPVKQIKYDNESNLSNDIKVINNSQNCNNYGYLIIKNITITESPKWLQNYLFLNDIRSINNVVDLTNYINLELNQPLHAYDLDYVGKNIFIDDNKNNTKTTILNDEIINTNGFTIVKNNKEILCLAGIMGCINGSINKNTKNILLESANWNDWYIRKIIKKVNFTSNAALSFSKKIPLNLIQKSLLRFQYLLKQMTNDYPTTFTKIKYIKKISKIEKTLFISYKKINNILGINLKTNMILKYVKKKFEIIESNNDGIIIKVPENRLDIEIDENIIEEIVKSYGLDNLPVEPININLIEENNVGFLENVFKIQNYFINLGFTEIKTYSLVEENEDYENIFKYKQIAIKNPLNKNNFLYRTSLLKSLYNCAKYNLLRNNYDVNLFEIAKVYCYNENDKIIEKNHVSFLISEEILKGPNIKAINTFSNCREIIINFLKHYNLSSKKINFEAITFKNKKINTNNSVYIKYKKHIIGIIITFSPIFLEIEKITNKNILSIEININEVVKLQKSQKIIFKPFSDRQIISRDIAFFVSLNIQKNDIINYIYQLNKLIRLVKIVDIYKKDNAESIMINIKFLPINEINNLEINEIIKNITTKLVQKYKIILR